MKDMNRSCDVKGPELLRPKEPEMAVKHMDEGKKMSETRTTHKFSLNDLHHGGIESPLKALGQQKVKVSGGDTMSMPKGAGRSVAKKMQYAEKKKDAY